MILDELANHAKERVEAAERRLPLSELTAMAKDLPKGDFRFQNTLKENPFSLICEVKKASPSKGIISPDFPYLKIAKEYEEAGADCVSVLTEPKWFLGSDEIFREIRSEISLPMIRKDFTVSEYMIYEAKVMGADAVLLIAAILSDLQLSEYLGICNELGLSALVETHDAEEIRRAVKVGSVMLGVNNRNLKDFSVDLALSASLRDLIPETCLFVSESGSKTPEDIRAQRAAGAKAVLCGEALMRSSDKKKFISEAKS